MCAAAGCSASGLAVSQSDYLRHRANGSRLGRHTTATPVFIPSPTSLPWPNHTVLPARISSHRCQLRTRSRCHTLWFPARCRSIARTPSHLYIDKPNRPSNLHRSPTTTPQPFLAQAAPLLHTTSSTPTESPILPICAPRSPRCCWRLSPPSLRPTSSPTLSRPSQASRPMYTT